MRDRHRRRRRHREEHAGQVDAGGRARRLAEVEVLDEQGRHDLHRDRQARTPAAVRRGSAIASSDRAGAAAWRRASDAVVRAALEAACWAGVAACAAFDAAGDGVAVLRGDQHHPLEAHLGQAEGPEGGDGPPPEVDLPPAMAEPGRGRGGVVVVVPALAARDERQPADVAGRVVVGAPAEAVADRVHGAAEAEVEDRVGEGGDQAPDRAEQHDQHADAEAEADEGVVEHVPVPPVGRHVLGVAANRLRVAGLAPVQGGVGELDPDPAEQLGRVRIALHVGVGVVLAVDRHPLPGLDADGDPHDEPEGEGQRRPEPDGPVGGGAVQVDRRGQVGELGDGETHEHGGEGLGKGQHRHRCHPIAYRQVGRERVIRPRLARCRQARRRDRVGEPTVSEHPSTREAILAEALHCFAEQGYDGTSLNDIAAGVGIRRPSLLHHFPSKEALYLEVFERSLSDWFVRVETASPAPNWSAGARSSTSSPAASASSRPTPTSCGSSGGRPSTAGPTSASTWPPSCGRCSIGASPTSRREMAAGTFRHHDPDQLLLTGYGALLSYFSDAPFLGGLLDADPLAPEVLDARLDHLLTFFRAALVAN